MAGFASQRPCRKTESPLGRTHWAGRTGQDSLGRTHWAGLTHTILADRLASVPMLECTPHTGQFDEASPTEGHGGHNWNNWHNRQNERNGLRTYVRMGTAGTAAIVSFHVRTYVRTYACLLGHAHIRQHYCFELDCVRGHPHRACRRGAGSGSRPG